MNLKQMLDAAYLAGFMSSAEGYNGEYPNRDNDMNPEDNSDWRLERDMDIKLILDQRSES